MHYHQSYVTQTNGRLYRIDIIEESGHADAKAMAQELAATFPNASGFEISQGTLKVRYPRVRPLQARRRNGQARSLAVVLS